MCKTPRRGRLVERDAGWSPESLGFYNVSIVNSIEMKDAGGTLDAGRIRAVQYPLDVTDRKGVEYDKTRTSPGDLLRLHLTLLLLHYRE